jgi:hypothetical protein
MVAVYVCGGSGDGRNKPHLDVSDAHHVRNLSAVLSEEEGLFALELLVACDGRTLKDLDVAEAKKLAEAIDSGEIAEAELTWDKYCSDEVRSWHAATIIHRVTKLREPKSPSARSLRIIAYPNHKARMQARMVTAET